jgi:hypothetical protein
MAKRSVNVWYDAEGDFLEVLFDRREGYFRSTQDDRVMEKVDAQGAVIGFSILGLSSMKGTAPLEIAVADED